MWVRERVARRLTYSFLLLCFCLGVCAWVLSLAQVVVKTAAPSFVAFVDAFLCSQQQLPFVPRYQQWPGLLLRIVSTVTSIDV